MAKDNFLIVAPHGLFFYEHFFVLYQLWLICSQVGGRIRATNLQADLEYRRISKHPIYSFSHLLFYAYFYSDTNELITS